MYGYRGKMCLRTIMKYYMQERKSSNDFVIWKYEKGYKGVLKNMLSYEYPCVKVSIILQIDYLPKWCLFVQFKRPTPSHVCAPKKNHI